MKTNVIYQGKFQEQADKIEPGSVDLILADPPYGQMKDFDYSQQPHQKEGSKSKEDLKWDKKIDPQDIFQVSNRILRKNGRLILFSKQPYTTELIKNQMTNLPHSYNMIWEKNNFANCLLKNKAPVNHYEEIVIFRKIHDTTASHPLREYFRKLKKFIGKPKTQIMERIGQKADHTFRINSSQFSLCTEETYKELKEIYDIEQMEGFKKYKELREIDKKVSSTFNLPEGQESKSNILKYSRDIDGHHPTQKPVALLEDLIKTFSNEGDLVVDLTAGSGSTGVAAKNCGREYILIEQKQEYVKIARERLSSVQKELIR